MQRILLIFLISICTCFFSYAQNEKWQVYLSYSAPVQVQEAGNSLYCITKGSGTINSLAGNLVRYDLQDGSVKTYDCLNDLSDKEILHMSFDEATGRLLLVYENGNIDLLDADDVVYNISALKENSILGENINSITSNNGMFYLCTNTALIEIDANDVVVRETYKQSQQLNGIAFCEGYIFVARKDGLYKLDGIAQIRDFKTWQKVSDKEFVQMQAFAGQLYALCDSRLNYIIPTDEGADIIEKAYYFSRISASSEGLICMDSGSWLAYFTKEKPSNPKLIQQKYAWTDVLVIEDCFYVCEEQSGLMQYYYDADNSKFLPLEEQSLISVSSPRRDLFYHMNYVGERLLVAGGINTQSAAYYPATFMFMTEREGNLVWTLFDEQTPRKEYPDFSHYNGVDLVQDPLDENHFYGAVYRNGLYEYRMAESGDIEFVNLYNYQNSPLQCIDVSTTKPWNFCTCTALQYDEKGNLWMANQQTDTIVRVLRPNGKWLSLYYPEIVETSNVFQYLFSSYGINFMVSLEGSGKGFFGFDTNGTLNAVEDDRHLLRYSITNQDGTTVLPTHFYCMTEDKDRQIWCGTNEGLFVITQPEEWFKSDFRFHQIKRNRNDGSGYADYLLAGVDITCITVDASNRKWIGTQSDGVYLVSHDGQETIHHFTTDNSPLLSNNVQSIAINPRTGYVMFGTDRGLCSYDEQVTEAENILSESNVRAYPNPVRPNTNANVTIDGLTDGAEVKILTSSGRVVWGTTSAGGSVRWNCCNMHGQRVPSGVYHVVCNTADAGQTVVTRIVVMK